MNGRIVFAVVVSAALLLGAGCATKGIYNVSNAPVATAPRRIRRRMRSSRPSSAPAPALGWSMKEAGPGKIIGTLNLRTHMAAVDVTYDTKAYSIQDKDSSNLNYDGTSIHNNYNGWVQNLDKGIRTQL